MKFITLKYRLIEANFIIRNKETYPKDSVLRAEKLLRENPYVEPKVKRVTDIDRDYLKNKYPKTY